MDSEGWWQPSLKILHIWSYNINKLAFGQTRFPAAADPIEHISEENFLLQIFAKMENFFDSSSPNYFLKIISLGGWTTTDPIEPISEEKSLLKNNCKDMFLFSYVILMAVVVSAGRRATATRTNKST